MLCGENINSNRFWHVRWTQRSIVCGQLESFKLTISPKALFHGIGVRYFQGSGTHKLVMPTGVSDWNAWVHWIGSHTSDNSREGLTDTTGCGPLRWLPTLCPTVQGNFHTRSSTRGTVMMSEQFTHSTCLHIHSLTHTHTQQSTLTITQKTTEIPYPFLFPPLLNSIHSLSASQEAHIPPHFPQH